MPLYLLKAAYTQASWQQMVTEARAAGGRPPRPNPPCERPPIVLNMVCNTTGPVAHALGGRYVDGWVAPARTGEVDFYVHLEMPTDEAASGVAMLLVAEGFIRAPEVTRLLTLNEALDWLYDTAQATRGLR